jgi:aminopeptidase YwaD
MRCTLLFLMLFAFSTGVHAQDEVRREIKEHINKLAAGPMEGRGYVHKGVDKAAIYIKEQFEQIGLYPVGDKKSFVQFYNFQVNTFPDAMQVTIKGKQLIPGHDFLVEASSSSFNASDIRVSTVDMDRVRDSAKWEELRSGFKAGKVYCLKNTDSFCKRMSVSPRKFPALLPDACYIIPVHGKMTWSVGTDTITATVLYIQDTVLPKRVKKASVNIRSILQPNFRSANLIGCVPGEVKDSFIVFSAHYDHLGRMGPAIFPGASDNASGTAMILYLARYFAKHPQHYSIAFIAFSGEEAGLKGSAHFVKDPWIPLANIKFVTNVDIMGDAKNGVTVVNATEYPEQFALMQSINKEKEYLPEIKSRGKSANSDHHHFSEAGVPAVFIYSNGGKGYYHDIFDKAASLTMENVVNVSKLLIDFTIQLNQQ